MSLTVHESASHCIGFDRPTSSPALAQQGLKHGYFDDTLTSHLLQLDDKDLLLNAGTYSHKELGQHPTKMSLLREGSYDQRIIPFVP